MAARLPLSDAAFKLVWSPSELAAFIGYSDTYPREHLVNGAGEKVAVSDSTDGDRYVAAYGLLIPARVDVNGHLYFFADEVRAVFRAAEQPIPVL